MLSALRSAEKACIVKKFPQKSTTSILFFYSSAPQFLFNNQKFFKSTLAKKTGLIIAAEQIIRKNNLDTANILFAGDTTIKLYNVAFATKWDSNFKSLGHS